MSSDVSPQAVPPASPQPWSRAGGRGSMTPRVVLAVLGLAMTVCLGACRSNPTTPAPENAIEILGVSPDQDVPADSLISFVVMTRYTLASQDSGVLMIGFNNEDSPTAYRISQPDSFLVVRGSGEHTFQVAARTKDWARFGSFGVYVSLSSHPHPYKLSWTPLVSDVHPIALLAPASPATGASARRWGRDGRLSGQALEPTGPGASGSNGPVVLQP